MYTISKVFFFEASHRLEGLPEEHPCARHHGHSYSVIIEMQSDALNNIGFIYDYRDMEAFKNWIENNLDHRHLNDVFDFNPTAENIAKYIFDKAKNILKDSRISSVTVKETAKTSATYRGEK